MKIVSVRYWGIRWSDFISNVDVQAYTDLRPLGEMAARHISVVGHIAWLQSSVTVQCTWRSAGTSICQLVVLLVPTGDEALVDPMLDG